MFPALSSVLIKPRRLFQSLWHLQLRGAQGKGSFLLLSTLTTYLSCTETPARSFPTYFSGKRPRKAISNSHSMVVALMLHRGRLRSGSWRA